MDRKELIRRLVLSEISDDYENVDQIIFPYVAQDGAKLGLAIERSEIVDALASLIDEGLAKAYLLSGKEPFSTELDGMPPLDVIEDYEKGFLTYFGITKKGMELHLSDDKWWPFDADGNPIAKTRD